MKILTLNKLNITWRDILPINKRKMSDNAMKEMEVSAIEAFKLGSSLLDLKATVNLFNIISVNEEKQILKLKNNENNINSDLWVGGYLSKFATASAVVISICTIGTHFINEVTNLVNSKNFMLMYSLDVFGVKALFEFGKYVDSYIKKMVEDMGGKVCIFVQPGSDVKWGMDGQRDLFKLGNGESLGLKINSQFIMTPQISTSNIWGVGCNNDVKETETLHICSKCQRKKSCIWCRENV